MRYHLHHNLDARYTRPYRPGDRLTNGHRSHITPEQHPDIGVLDTAVEAVFWHHNAASRPDAFDAPALAIGDVIILDDEHAYSVAPVGFERVTVDLADLLHISYRDAMRTDTP